MTCHSTLAFELNVVWLGVVPPFVLGVHDKDVRIAGRGSFDHAAWVFFGTLQSKCL